MKVFLSVMMLLLATLLVSVAMAAPGGNGKGKGLGRQFRQQEVLVAACSVSPNPVAQYADYEIDGSGFPGNTFVNVLITDDVGTSVFMPQTTAAGDLPTITWRGYWQGTHTVEVREVFDALPSVLLATCTFEVNALE